MQLIMNLIQKFNLPDNKKLKNIANFFLYIAGPLGTLYILYLRNKKILSADETIDFLAAWASLVGGFKLATKFSSKENTNITQ